MAMTDPIADMLTRIRNANTVSKDMVDIPASRVKAQIAQILKDEGFIRDYKMIKEGNPQGMIRVYMKYGPEDEKIINGLKRISKPGLRVYAQKDEIPRVLGGLGIAIISTSSGVMTDKEARNKKLGGEVICYIW